MVEIKAIKELEDVHLAQAINYLEAYNMEIGLLINFGSVKLQIKRVMKPVEKSRRSDSYLIQFNQFNQRYLSVSSLSKVLVMIIDLYEALKNFPNLSRQLTCKDLMFTQYDCPQATKTQEFFLQTNLIVYVLTGTTSFCKEQEQVGSRRRHVCIREEGRAQCRNGRGCRMVRDDLFYPR